MRARGLLRREEFNLESTWRTLQQPIMQSGGFLVFVTAVNLLLLLKAENQNHEAPRHRLLLLSGGGGWGGESGPAPGTDSAPEAPRATWRPCPRTS